MFAFIYIYDTDDYEDAGQFEVVAASKADADAALKAHAAAKGMTISVAAWKSKAA